MTSVLRTALVDLARLVVPVQCPGCGAWDELLCAACEQPLRREPWRCEDLVPRLAGGPGEPLPVWAVTTYDGPVRGTVVAWKDRGRADLGGTTGRAARRAGHRLAPLLVAALEGEAVAVVPVPSSAGAVRRRGADLVRGLAEEVAAGLLAGGVEAAAVPLLTRRRRARDQVGLGARARRRNQAGSVAVRDGGAGRGRGWCLLVDDVVTTGSTLAAAATALSASGRLVLGAVCLAVTPPPTRPGAPLPDPSPGG